MPGASILIADDDATSARFLQRLLSREGHHVSIVTTEAEALSGCESNPPDLLLIDLVAPGRHGFDVCHQLKEHRSTRSDEIDQQQIGRIGFAAAECLSLR